MADDIQRAIQAMLSTLRPSQGSAAAAVAKPVFCISRDYGSGGDDIGMRLAQRLGINHFDSEILGKIIQRTGGDPEAMKSLDEGVAKARDLWLYSLVTGQDLTRDTYKRHLVNVIMSLARLGGVIVGRGAHIVLSKTPAVRVRITGSTDVCAKRIAAAEGLSLEAARQKFADVNAERGKFIWDTYQVRLNDPTTFDFTINTDRIENTGIVVDMLVNACDLIAGKVA